MAKRYTEDEDAFIISHFDAVGARIGPHDLGRSESSVKARAKHLKETGAWAFLENSWEQYMLYQVAAGHIPKTAPVYQEYLDKIVRGPKLSIVATS